MKGKKKSKTAVRGLILKIRTMRATKGKLERVFDAKAYV